MEKKIVFVGRVLRATAKDGYVFKLKTVTRDDAEMLRKHIIRNLTTGSKSATCLTEPWDIIDDRVK